jgi:hypothetical protein
MGTKRPMSPNSSYFIKPHSSHPPFASSRDTTSLSSTSSPMQTTNHPVVTLLILTNHTPPTSAPYQPLTLHVNERSQFYTFPNPFDHPQLGHFPLPILLVPTIGLDHTPQPTPISSTRLQPPLKVSCPTYEHQFTNRRLVRHQHFC